MRKVGVFIVSFICIILCYFIVGSINKVFKTDWELPRATDQEENKYRIVLITQDLETPFWDKVGEGAIKQAHEESVSLEIWGSYGNNQEEFLKKIEIAIFSQVDGIIVQGLDTDEFKELTKIKAASFGIPIITIANDVPMDESLRRTYVGSNQYMAGELIAKQLVTDMGTETAGDIILMFDQTQQYYQKQRIEGIKNVISEYPNMNIIETETGKSREQVIASTKDILNQNPNVHAFIAVSANISGAIIQEMEGRFQIDPYFIYSFEDDSETLSLLNQGKIDGMIEQSPIEMGEISVHVMTRWLTNEKVPLDLDGYYTDIEIVKAIDVK